MFPSTLHFPACDGAAARSYFLASLTPISLHFVVKDLNHKQTTNANAHCETQPIPPPDPHQPFSHHTITHLLFIHLYISKQSTASLTSDVWDAGGQAVKLHVTASLCGFNLPTKVGLLGCLIKTRTRLLNFFWRAFESGILLEFMKILKKKEGKEERRGGELSLCGGPRIW